MSKITNPMVLIFHHKTPWDSYSIAITSGSEDFRDATYTASVGADYIDERMNNWSKTGYYMAAEIETLRRICAEAYQCVGVLADRCGALDDMGFIKLLDNLSQMKLVHDDLLPFQLSFCENSGLPPTADAGQSGTTHAPEPVQSVSHVDEQSLPGTQTAPSLDSASKNAESLPGNKKQITSSMAKEIAFKLGAELNDEESDIFADGYNAALLAGGKS